MNDDRYMIIILQLHKTATCETRVHHSAEITECYAPVFSSIFFPLNLIQGLRKKFNAHKPVFTAA